MAQGQDILKVFVAKKFIKATGKKLSDLTPGDFGIFDLSTNVTVADFKPKRTYLAINMGGKIYKSPNMWIENDNIKSISKTGVEAHKDKIVTFKNFTITCGKDYTLRVEASNELTKFLQGTNNFNLFLTARSEECWACGTSDPCKEINPLPVILEFLRNSKRNPYVKLEATARAAITAIAGVTAAAGDVLTIAQLQALSNHNKTQTTPANLIRVDLKITSIPIERRDYKDEYIAPRNTDINVGIDDGFLGNGVLAVAQNNVVEQGSGFDLKNIEWTTIGDEYNSRYSELTRKEFHPKSFLDETKSYNVLTIRYGLRRQVTSHLYDHTSEVLIAYEPGATDIEGPTGTFEKAVKDLEADSRIGL